MRIEYPDALHHVMSPGKRRQDSFPNAVVRQEFIRTLAEVCWQSGFVVHAYCLMSNHFHLVVESPNANLVPGMRWLFCRKSSMQGWFDLC